MSQHDKYYDGWLNHRTFLNVQVIGLRAKMLAAPVARAHIYAFEDRRCYCVYQSSCKPPDKEMTWISNASPPCAFKIRYSTSLRVVLYAPSGKVHGETKIIRVLKEVAQPYNHTLGDEQRLGPYTVVQEDSKMGGNCEIILYFDSDGNYSGPTGPIAAKDDVMLHHEPTAVGHKKVLRWFVKVMRILLGEEYKLWPIFAKLAWLTLARLWRYHHDVHSTLHVRSCPAEDILTQMKSLLFALMTFPNLDALNPVVGRHVLKVELGDMRNTVGDLTRLLKVPPDVQEKLAKTSTYAQGGLMNELFRLVLAELCTSTIILEESMYEYRATYKDILLSPMYDEVKARQLGLYVAQFRTTMFLSQGCTVPIVLNVKTVVNILLYYIHGEADLPDHQRHYTHCLVSATGLIAVEVQEMLYKAALSSARAVERDKFRRLLTSSVQRAKSLPKFLYLDQVTIEKGIGGGGFGDVFRGSWTNETVAVKSVKALRVMPEDAKTHSELALEIITWKTLNHPHILDFYGVAAIPTISDVCMVSPFMPGQTVRQRFYIDTNEQPHGQAVGASDVNEPLRQQILKEVVTGMIYLHDEGVIHGDLRADNLFLDADDHVKIADFGLCVYSEGFSRNYFSMRTSNARWAAPEIITPRVEKTPGDNKQEDTAAPPQGMMRVGRPKKASDIYSFTCVCIELYSHAAPYQDLANEASVIHFVTSKRDGSPGRPGRPPELIIDDLWSLIQRCWDETPEARPCFLKILEEMSVTLP